MNAFHMMSINSHPQAQVHAICGRDLDKARAVACEHGVPHVHDDWRDLLARDDLDAVVVGTPDHLHHEMVLAAAEVGLHIVCEKPLAQRLDQALQMLRAVEATPRNHMTFFTYRWLPHYRRLHQLVHDGFVGRILSAQFSYFIGVPAEPRYDWHYDPARGTGSLGNLGSHLVYLARWLVGEVESVTAVSTALSDRLGDAGKDVDQLDDTVLLSVRFEGGAVGSLQVAGSVSPPGQEQQCAIRGEQGTLQLSLVHDEGLTLRGGRRDEPLTVLAGPDDLWDGVDLSRDAVGRFVDYFTSQPVGLRQFVDDTLTGTPSVPDLGDGVRVQAVLEAAALSARSGRVERVGAG